MREAERSMAEKDSVRCQIVEAAKKRFSHFGYGKTTMAEVAGEEVAHAQIMIAPDLKSGNGAPPLGDLP